MPQRLIVLSEFASGLWGGKADVALPGSGQSVPKGLECVFEYNGLVFHDRLVVDKYRVTKITGLNDATIRDGAREPRPDDHGEDVGESKYGGRTLLFEGSIMAGNIGKLRDMQQGLRTAFLSLEEKPLILRTGDINTDVQIFCRKYDKIGGDEEQTNLRPHRPFQIPLHASNPRFMSLLSQIHGKDFGADYVGELFNAPNRGNFEAQPTIKITNPPTSLIITNETLMEGESTPRRIKIYGGPGAPSKLIYNTAQRELVDEDGNPYYSLLDTVSDDIAVGPGDNVFTCEAVGGGPDMRVEIEYAHTWM